jgi:mRNA-degrading endonuclease toxin of MazEF toxin-antitoxin module
VTQSEWQTVLVVPTTTALIRAELPFCVILPKGKETGLPRRSVAVPHWLTAVSKSRFGERLGRVPGAAMLTLEAGAARLLGLAS